MCTDDVDEVGFPDMGTKAKSKPYQPGEMLAGVTHLGEHLGTTSTWGRQLATREDFPKPVLSVLTKTRTVDYWRPAEVEAWAAQRDAVAPVPETKQRRPKGWTLDEPKAKAPKPVKQAPAPKPVKPVKAEKAVQKPQAPAKAPKASKEPKAPAKAPAAPERVTKLRRTTIVPGKSITTEVVEKPAVAERKPRPNRAEQRERKAAKAAAAPQPLTEVLATPPTTNVSSLADRLAAKAAAL